jgi:hypothetical protein
MLDHARQRCSLVLLGCVLQGYGKHLCCEISQDISECREKKESENERICAEVDVAVATSTQSWIVLDHGIFRLTLAENHTLG